MNNLVLSGVTFYEFSSVCYVKATEYLRMMEVLVERTEHLRRELDEVRVELEVAREQLNAIAAAQGGAP